MSNSARIINNGKKNNVTVKADHMPISQRIPHSNLASMSISSKSTLIKHEKESKQTTNSQIPVSANGCDESIKWTPASEFLKSENGSSKSGKPENGASPGEMGVMRREPSYIRLSRVLNGYISNGYPKGGPSSGSRSKTPDPHAARRSYDSPLNRKVLANGSTPKYISARMLQNGQEMLSSNENGLDIDPRLENCSSYCFKLPDFSAMSSDGEGYKKLVEDVLKLLKTHLEKTTTLLLNQDLLPEEVSESVRVAVGRTELLLKKRMAQFTKQLHSHLNPETADKLTTLNDLHGLWTLVDIQLADIRNCFEQVEKSRLIGWQTPRQTLTTAASMPSLLLPPTSRRPSTENGQKVLLPKPLGLKNVDSAANKEKELQRKAVMEAKRQELNRQRRALIDAKRAELNNHKEELVINKE